MFQGRLRGVPRVQSLFQRGFKAVSKTFKESFKCGFRKISQKVSRMFQKSFVLQFCCLYGSHRSYLSRRRAFDFLISQYYQNRDVYKTLALKIMKDQIASNLACTACTLD